MSRLLGSTPLATWTGVSLIRNATFWTTRRCGATLKAATPSCIWRLSPARLVTLTIPSFDINVAGTYNLFEAAERAGIKRIAQASSINALGGYWGCDDRQFEYFPLDEAHPLHTTDAYSLSKQLVEEIAAYYWRRSGISSVSFRLPAVWSEALIEQRQLRQSSG